MPQTRKDVIDALDSYTYDLERELRDTKARLARVLEDLAAKQERITVLIDTNRALREALSGANQAPMGVPLQSEPPARPAVVTYEEYRLGGRPSEK